jgi:hypothetical protein
MRGETVTKCVRAHTLRHAGGLCCLLDDAPELSGGDRLVRVLAGEQLYKSALDQSDMSDELARGGVPSVSRAAALPSSPAPSAHRYAALVARAPVRGGWLRRGGCGGQCFRNRGSPDGSGIIGRVAFPTLSKLGFVGCEVRKAVRAVKRANRIRIYARCGAQKGLNLFSF